MTMINENIIVIIKKAENVLEDLMKDADGFKFTKSRKDSIIISRNNMIALRIYFEGLGEKK